MTSTRHVIGFSEVLDWRPIDFVDLPGVKSCHLCGVVPHITFVTECCHAFCHSCYQSIRRKGQRCPYDGIYFDEGEVQVSAFKERQLEDLKARCRNWGTGCDFVGTTKQVLDHFLNMCAYHTVACPKCGVVVLRSDILQHYSERCLRSAVAAATSGPLPPCGRNDFVADVLSVSKNIEAALSAIAQEQVELKNSVNRMVADASDMDDRMTALEAVRVGLADFLETQRIVGDSQQSLVLAVKEKVDGMYSRLQSGNFVDLDLAVCPRATAEMDTAPGLSSANCTVSSHAEDVLDNRCNNLISFTDAILSITKGLISVENTLTKGLTSLENRLSEVLSSTQLGPNKAFFHVQEFAALKMQAKMRRPCHKDSEPIVVGGYAARLTVALTLNKGVLHLGIYFGICQSSCDTRLKWPFSKSFTLILVHPSDDEKNIERTLTSEKVSERASLNFSRPCTVANTSYGFREFAQVDNIEKDGFVFNDAVCVAVRLE